MTKGVGPIFACQQSIKLFIKDINNINDIAYAKSIYKWLGLIECTIDELCEISYEKSVFILQVLQKYKIQNSDSNILLNYYDAIESLKYQINLKITN
jgi:hypothetical protein